MSASLGWRDGSRRLASSSIRWFALGSDTYHRTRDPGRQLSTRLRRDGLISITVNDERRAFYAGEARPAIVSALSDPMLSPSLDHLPFMLNGADFSVAIEQQIRLSGCRADELFYAYMVDNQAIVIPETIDAIRALTRSVEEGNESIAQTNAALGIGPGLI